LTGFAAWRGAHALVEIQKATGDTYRYVTYFGTVDYMIERNVAARNVGVLADFTPYIIEHRWFFAGSLITALGHTKTGLAFARMPTTGGNTKAPSVVLTRRTEAARLLIEIITTKPLKHVMPFAQKRLALKACTFIIKGACAGEHVMPNAQKAAALKVCKPIIHSGCAPQLSILAAHLKKHLIKSGASTAAFPSHPSSTAQASRAQQAGTAIEEPPTLEGNPKAFAAAEKKAIAALESNLLFSKEAAERAAPERAAPAVVTTLTASEALAVEAMLECSLGACGPLGTCEDDAHEDCEKDEYCYE